MHISFLKFKSSCTVLVLQARSFFTQGIYLSAGAYTANNKRPARRVCMAMQDYYDKRNQPFKFSQLPCDNLMLQRNHCQYDSKECSET